VEVGVFEGGDRFIQHYLQQFSKREDHEDFKLRKEISYCPGFSKIAINEVKNSILQRLPDITRYGGPKSYQRAMHGLDGGVDRRSSSMNAYLGLHVIIELLIMSRVGIFIDMPELPGPTILDKGSLHPYVYMYRTEQIRSWTYNPENPEILTSVLLEEEEFAIDEKTGLTVGVVTNFRHMWMEDNHVICMYYNSAGEPLEGPYYIEMDRIPFVILEISSSLLADVANYQIALLNLESSDLSYMLRSNFPFYTEQFDPRTISPHLKQPGWEQREEYKNHVNHVSAVEKVEEITVGMAAGRRYPIGSERPQFIAPPAEPMKISMEKAEQLKADIRRLVNLAVQNLQPKRASASSKIADERPLESGLSYIGLELERAEQQISWFWSAYEGSRNIAVVKYPETYELKSDEERKAEADHLSALVPQVASNTFRKEVMKRIVDLTLSPRLSYDTVEKIKNEIDGIPTVHSDPEVLTQDLENGLVGLDLASRMRGYPDGEVDKAKQDHAERIARIAAAQAPGMGYGSTAPGARGADDLSLNPKEGKDEKQAARQNMVSVVPSDNGRGEAGS
jgi:hypothetical protein